MFILLEQCIESPICSSQQSWDRQQALLTFDVYRECFWISHHVWSRFWSSDTPKTDVF